MMDTGPAVGTVPIPINHKRPEHFMGKHVRKWAITHRAETIIASIVPGAHDLQRGVVFITRAVQLLYASCTLVLLCCINIIISLI
jgi:hypothetical protein